jgi:hypothetical protein
VADQAYSFYEEAKSIAEKGSSAEKIQLAQRRNVPPEILYYLATDENPEVRGAVALNTDTPHQADLILADDKHDAVKEYLIKKVSDQAKVTSRLVDPKKADFINDILDHLAADQSVSIRRALVKAIKRIATLSKELVLKLARDTDDEVAQAMVRSSHLLEEEDLDVLIDEKRGPVISAVASRDEVSEHTADNVVEADFTPAVTHLLSNKTARMSEHTLNIIAEQSSAHEEWQEAFVTREGLSLDVIKKLSLFISNTLIKTLLEHNYLDDSQVKDVLEIVQKRIDSGELDAEVLGILAEPPEPFSSAYDRAKDDFLKGKLKEDLLLEKMEDTGERAYVIGAISVLSCIPYDLVIREINAQNVRGLVAIIWKAGLSAQFSLEFQETIGNAEADKILYPKDQNFPMTKSELDWQLELIFDQD